MPAARQSWVFASLPSVYGRGYMPRLEVNRYGWLAALIGFILMVGPIFARHYEWFEPVYARLCEACTSILKLT
jgi:hypothetical protein